MRALRAILAAVASVALPATACTTFCVRGARGEGARGEPRGHNDRAQLRDPGRRGAAGQGHTQWQIVYDLANATIHYRTTANRERRSIALSAFDYACKASGRMLDIDTRRGDMTAQFMPYAPEANERQMLAAFAKSPHYSMPTALVRNEAAKVDARPCVSA